MSVPIFKGKRDLLTPNSYRGIKLLENDLGDVVYIDKMQYRFMPRERDC